jgi:hypothetical protein
MSADEETYDEEEEEETKFLNAEEVTLIATNFLKRLGNKQGLKPIKASLEEDDVYVVEVGLAKKTAMVQIDATTEQIKEYEIKDKEQETPESAFIPLTPKNIIMLAGISGASVVISALLGISSLLPSIL